MLRFCLPLFRTSNIDGSLVRSAGPDGEVGEASVIRTAQGPAILPVFFPSLSVILPCFDGAIAGLLNLVIYT